jgi:hypothetical protein
MNYNFFSPILFARLPDSPSLKAGGTVPRRRVSERKYRCSRKDSNGLRMFREDVLQSDRNLAMTDVEKDTALIQLGALQKSVKGTRAGCYAFAIAGHQTGRWKPRELGAQTSPHANGSSLTSIRQPCKIRLHVERPGVYLQERFSQEHGLDLLAAW